MLRQVCFQHISKLGVLLLEHLQLLLNWEFPGWNWAIYAPVGKVMVFLHGL